MARRDFVAEMLGLVSEVGGVEPSALATLEAQIRQRFGGERVAILTTAPTDREARLAQINAGLSKRKRVTEIAAELGVSRVTVYRNLKLKCRSKGKQ